MSRLKAFWHYFSTAEKLLWFCSVTAVFLAFFIFDRSNHLALAVSLVGVSALIFIAKGNPAGHAMMIVFSLLYSYISYTYAYYGEMSTYLGMGLPMAVIALVTWLKNPYKGKKSQVAIRKINKKDLLIMVFLTIAVTVIFYFILKAFNTANLIPSTISVATSFLGVYLTFRRSPYYALGYVANDIVLIVLWILASAEDISYISLVVCFAAFLANDVYGFVNWRRMEKKQAAS